MTTKLSKDSLRAKRQEKERASLEKLMGGPLTFGEAIEAFRLSEEMTQVVFAKLLDITPQKLCDIEKGRRTVSAERAAHFARKLGHPITVFVQLALQDQLNEGGVKLKVHLSAS